MAKKKNRKDRRAKLIARQRKEAAERDKGAGSVSKIFDFSKAKDVKFYKPTKGKCKLDIIPYEVATKNHPQFGSGPDDLEIGDLDFKLDFYQHKNVGPEDDSVLCLKGTYGKRCYICEERAGFLEQGYEWDSKEVKALNASRRSMYNVIDVDDDTDELLLFEVSHFLFEKEMMEEAETGDDEFITFADLEDGRVVNFKAVEDSYGGFKFFKYKNFSFSKRKQVYDDEMIDAAVSLDGLLLSPTYEEIKALFLGIEDDEEEETKPKRKKRKAKPAPEPEPEEEEEEEIEEEEEEEEIEPPKRKKKKRSRPTPEPEEEEDDEEEDDNDEEEEDDEPEEKPKRKSRKSKSKSRCPAKGTFGKDCNQIDDCVECDDSVYEACADEQEKLG